MGLRFDGGNDLAYTMDTNTIRHRLRSRILSFCNMFKKPMCSGTAIQKVIGTYELLEMILKELEIDDLISASLVSKEWSRVALDFKGLHQQLVRLCFVSLISCRMQFYKVCCTSML